MALLAMKETQCALYRTDLTTQRTPTRTLSIIKSRTVPTCYPDAGDVESHAGDTAMMSPGAAMSPPLSPAHSARSIKSFVMSD